MIAIIAIVLFFVYLGVNILAVVVRNYNAHKFFSVKSAQLPVVPNANIFSGHMVDIIQSHKNCLVIDELHKKYGPTFGYYVAEQPWVSTKDPDLIKLISVDQAYKHLDRAFMGFPFEETNHSIAQVNGDTWRHVRRIFTPALSNHKVKSEEVSSDIESVVQKLYAALESHSRKAFEASGGKSVSFVVDARDYFDRYTLAVIMLLTYKKADLIDFSSERDEWVHTIDTGSRDVPNPVITAAMIFPFLRTFCNFLGRFHGMGRVILRIVDFIEEATDLNRSAREQHAQFQRKLSLSQGDQYKEKSFEEVKSAGSFKRRLVDTIIDAFLDKKLTQNNFVGSLVFLMLAGFKTTSDTISGLVWRLAKNPDVQEKLRTTLWEEGIDADYVMWCILELIRLQPAVPLGAGRVLGEDVKLNEATPLLPKGTFVMSSTWSVHHDPHIWPDPERYDPERWRDQANFHPAQFVGFGLGPRNCVGGKLAIQEIKLVIRMLLNTYRIEVCDETPDQWYWSSPGMFYTLNEKPNYLRFVPLKRTEL